MSARLPILVALRATALRRATTRVLPYAVATVCITHATSSKETIS